LLVGVGLSIPMAGTILMNAGVASAAARDYKPTRRGGGGMLKLLMWQGPTLLNPHFATGTKDIYGARVFYQSLAEFDSEGNLIPVLAAELPTIQNGQLSPDGMSVVWNLRSDVKWHDGKPFTADDVVFNQEYASDPAAAAVTMGVYEKVRVEKLGPHRVRLKFRQPTPYWAEAFVGARGMMIPRHLFDDYRGAKSREAPANLKPVGTGAFRFVSFVPGDTLRASINTEYYEHARPHFDTVEMKGGGDAVSAARAVLQTGEFDYAWNVLVEDEILKRLEAGGKGRVVITPGGTCEFIQLNTTDPGIEVDGERSSIKTPHPVFSDRAVRDAFKLLIDRQSIIQHVFGRTAVLTPNYVENPRQFRSPNTRWEFNIDKANAILDQAGWKRGGSGVREKAGRKMKFLFQTSTNAPRQKVQAIVKQACQRAGMDLELKSIPASVFFSSDAGNNDTNNKFYADIQMYAFGGNVDPELFMRNYTSSQVPTKQNKWALQNAPRWRNAEYDAAFGAAQVELDPVKRAAFFIKANDILVGDGHVIPIANRPGVAAVAKSLRAQLSSWSSDIFLIQDWYREA
ncbi:MAG TPA: peptide ABC transporter substrate-binding protein, partial [Burkholderiales bacterium]|nr:peptide ABC transporter substrate-binding protein [Burkholderiales bacterium]